MESVMTYSLDFRKKVLEIRERKGLTVETAAKLFGIGEASLFRWMQRLEAKRKRNKPPTKIPSARLLQEVKDYPDAYQAERAARLGVSKSGIGYALKRLKLTRKKNV